jgi:hypothetical protein
MFKVESSILAFAWKRMRKTTINLSQDIVSYIRAMYRPNEVFKKLPRIYSYSFISGRFSAELVMKCRTILNDDLEEMLQEVVVIWNRTRNLPNTNQKSLPLHRNYRCLFLDLFNDAFQLLRLCSVECLLALPEHESSPW